MFGIVLPSASSAQGRDSGLFHLVHGDDEDAVEPKLEFFLGGADEVRCCIKAFD